MDVKEIAKMEQVIKRLEKEIEELLSDVYYVRNNVSITAIQNAISIRQEKIKELKK
jgi:hypothetical protein